MANARGSGRRAGATTESLTGFLDDDEVVLIHRGQPRRRVNRPTLTNALLPPDVLSGLTMCSPLHGIC